MAAARCPHCQAPLHAEDEGQAVFCGACGRRVEGWAGETAPRDEAPAALPDGGAPTRRAELAGELLAVLEQKRAEKAKAAKAQAAPVKRDDPGATQPLPTQTRPTDRSMAAASASDPGQTIPPPPDGPRALPILALTAALAVCAGTGAFWLVRHFRAPPPAAPAPPRADVVVNLDQPVVEQPPSEVAGPSTKRRRARTVIAARPPVVAPPAAKAPPAAPPPVQNPYPDPKPVVDPPKPPPVAAAPAAPAIPEELPGEQAPPSEEDLKEQAKAAAYADGIRFVLRAHRAQVVACYERAFKDAPAAPGGRVVVDFTVGQDGRAHKVAATANTTGQELLGKCLESRVAEWDFPRPPDGEFATSYPFVFSAGS